MWRMERRDAKTLKNDSKTLAIVCIFFCNIDVPKVEKFFFVELIEILQVSNFCI